MLRFMQREIDWIIEALEQDKSKTQTGLAEAIGIDKTSVSKMLNRSGKSHGRRLKYEEALRAAAYLGINPSTIREPGFAEEPSEFAPPRRLAPEDAIAKLYASAVSPGGLWRIYLERPIERRSQPSQLAGADLAFGFYAPDDAMAPRFFTGETVWVNPARPVAVGQDALLLSSDAPKNEMRALLCLLEGKSATAFFTKQYRDLTSAAYPLSDWRAVYVFGRE